MEVCAICRMSNVSICALCKLSFCDKHKAIHQKSHTIEILHYQKIKIITDKLIPGARALSNREFRDFNIQFANQLSESSNKLNELKSMSLTDLKAALIQEYQISLEAQIHWISSVSITNDNKYVFYASSDHILRIWSIEDNLQTPFFQFDSSVTELVITNDDKFLIVVSRNIIVLNLQYRIQEFRLVCPGRHKVCLLTLTNDNNHIISAASDGSVILWNFHNRVQEVELHDGSKGNCSGFILAPTNDDRYLLKATEEYIVIWNLQTKNREAILTSGQPFSRMLTRDSILNINTDSSGLITAYICRRNKQIALLRGYTTSVDFLPMQGNTPIIAVDEDQNTRSRSILLEIEGGLVEDYNSGCTDELVTADKKYVIYARGQYIFKSNINDETDKIILYNCTDPIWNLLISKDGNYVVSLTRQQNNMKIWNINEKKLQCALQGHTKKVTSAIITRNNRYIISGSHDRTVRIWNIQERIQEAVLEGHTDSVTCVAISLDDKYIISASDDYTLRIWSLEEKDKGIAESVFIIGASLNNMVVRGSKYIVSRLANNTVKVWKVNKKNL